MNNLGKFVYDQSPRQLFHFLRRKLNRRQRLPGFDRHHPCVFVLSTGRVGSETLAALLVSADNVFAYHEPMPNLYYLSKLSHAHHADPLARTILRGAFLTAREDLLDYSLDCGRGYVETGPTGTFLAPFILDAIADARFIHLVRDPRAVVRSGMRRKWYDGHFNDNSRIVPDPASEAGRQWKAFGPLQKNIWLWHETNRWIMEFFARLPGARALSMRSEDLFSGRRDAIDKLFAFIDAPVPSGRRLERVLGKKLNAQFEGDFPEALGWTAEMTGSLKAIAGATAQRLGYEIP
jgi:sulfotransferase family protein